MAATGDMSFVNAPAALSPNPTKVMDPPVQSHGEEDIETTPEANAPQGISILKEIFPEHDADSANAAGKAAPPPLQQLLGSVPSPARATPTSIHQNSQAPTFGPPTHAPMPLAAPVLPPPPPMLPAQACRQREQEQWESFRNMAQPEQSVYGSYRERLRAGGRNAFQRAYDAGLVPKNMKNQEWTPQSHEMQIGATGMPYNAMGDGNQMWNSAVQMQSTDYCGMQMQPQYQCMQQVQMQPQMQQPMQMLSMPAGDQSPQMGQMNMTPMAMSQMQMQMPPMALSQVQTPVNTPASTASGDSTPTELMSVRSECMAILMPQASQFPCNNDMLAAQLKEMAADQRYED